MLNDKEREKIKATYRPIMEDKDIPMYLRIHAAEQVIGCLYCRSIESYVKPVTDGDVIYYAHLKGHPDIRIYTAMLLKQGNKSLHMPYDVFRALVHKYGIMGGIKSGTYFIAEKQPQK